MEAPPQKYSPKEQKTRINAFMTRLIDSCITQLKAQGSSRTRHERVEEEEEEEDVRTRVDYAPTRVSRLGRGARVRARKHTRTGQDPSN